MENKSSLNRQILEARKAHQDAKYQELRVINQKSSRLLDNYYNSKIHPKKWEPSGCIQTKNEYVYDVTGLGYKIKDITNINPNQEVKPKVTSGNLAEVLKNQFLELEYLETDEVLVIIEHCFNCEEHLDRTNHANDIYRRVAKLIQNSIMSQFPFIKCCLKPIDTNQRSQIKRLGGLEIYLGTKFKNILHVEEIFSKLKTGNWPNIHNILCRINYAMPVFNIKCVLYDNEEGENNSILTDDNHNGSNMNVNNTNPNNINSNNKNQYHLPSKYENLKVNLYSYICEKVIQNCKELADILDMHLNPKRRIESGMNRTKAYTSINTNNTNNKNNSNKSKSNYSNITNYKNINTNEKENTLKRQTQTNNYNSTNNAFYNTTQNLQKIDSTSFPNIRPSEIIEDLSIVNEAKGKLLSTGFTNNEGIVFFKNVPYDSYIVEVENSRMFLGCGMLVQMNKIITEDNIKSNNCSRINNLNSNDNSNKLDNILLGNENHCITKLFGLRRQVDAFVEVFVYSKQKGGNDFDLNLVSDARVFLANKIDNNQGENSNGNNQGDVCKYFVKENNKIKGKYEIITVTGDFTLTVFKEGYQGVTKDVTLKNGINKFNVQLFN